MNIVLKRAADHLHAYAESLRGPCSSPEEGDFCCDDCPAEGGPKECAAEHAAIVESEQAVRAASGNITTPPDLTAQSETKPIDAYEIADHAEQVYAILCSDQGGDIPARILAAQEHVRAWRSALKNAAPQANVSGEMERPDPTGPAAASGASAQGDAKVEPWRGELGSALARIICDHREGRTKACARALVDVVAIVEQLEAERDAALSARSQSERSLDASRKPLPVEALAGALHDRVPLVCFKCGHDQSDPLCERSDCPNRTRLASSSIAPIDVDWLANVIRTASGDHLKPVGAGALAEIIVGAIQDRKAAPSATTFGEKT